MSDSEEEIFSRAIHPDRYDFLCQSSDQSHCKPGLSQLTRELVITSLFEEDPSLNLIVIFYPWREGWLCNKDTIFSGWVGLRKGGGGGGEGLLAEITIYFWLEISLLALRSGEEHRSVTFAQLEVR